MFRFSRDIRLLFASMFTFAVAFGFYLFTFPIYARDLGASAVDLGLLFSISFFANTAVAIPGGVLADRFDRKWLMVAGWAMCIPVPLMYIYATTWQHLIPGLVVFNFSMFCMAAYQAYLAERSDPGRLNATFTFVYAGFPLGLSFSPVLGGYIGETWGMEPVFILSLIGYAVSTMFLLFLTPLPGKTEDQYQQSHDQHHHGQTFQGQQRRRGSRLWLPYGSLLQYGIVFATAWFVINTALPFSSPFLEDVAGMGIGTIGLLGSIGAVAGGLAAPLVGYFADRSNGLLLLATTLLLTGISFSILVIADGFALIALAFVVRGALESGRSLMGSVIGTAVDRAEAGKGYAFYNLAVGLGMAGGPYLGGWLYRISPQVPFTLAAGLLVPIIALLFTMGRSQLRKEPSEAGVTEPLPR